LVDEALQLALDLLPATEKVGERRAADDVAQSSLGGPADRLRVVLHFERRPLHVVNHPEEHRIDVHRNGVGSERLLGGEARGDGPLIDPGGDAIDERHDPEEARSAQADEAPEAEYHRALPLLGDARRLHQHEAGREDRGGHEQAARGPPLVDRQCRRREQDGDGDEVDARDTDARTV
jgi:hypothetical protein